MLNENNLFKIFCFLILFSTPLYHNFFSLSTLNLNCLLIGLIK